MTAQMHDTFAGMHSRLHQRYIDHEITVEEYTVALDDLHTIEMRYAAA